MKIPIEYISSMHLKIYPNCKPFFEYFHIHGQVIPPKPRNNYYPNNVANVIWIVIYTLYGQVKTVAPKLMSNSEQ